MSGFFIPRGGRPVLVGLAALVPLLALAQDVPDVKSPAAPGGYSGAVNSPTAKVLPLGVVAVSLANSIPDIPNPYPGLGSFGVLTGGVGLLPGLEAFGRLSFSGDTRCNMYDPDYCTAGERDLSVSAKYQLPFVLPGNTRVAAGFTDYGGAATQYRSTYAVATSDLGPVDVSLGYAKRVSPKALLDGVFASTMVRLTERLSAQLESDTREVRAGVAYVQQISGDSDLALSFSQKLTDTFGQQSAQMSFSWVLYPERARSRALQQHAAPLLPLSPPASSSGPSPVSTGVAVPAAPQAVPQAELSVASVQGLDALGRAFADAGFAHIRIRILDQADAAPLLALHLEPVGWRQSRVAALGQALKVWLRWNAAQEPAGQAAQAQQELLLVLTQRGQPVMGVRTRADCAATFRSGFDSCGEGSSLRFVAVQDLEPAQDGPTLDSQWLRPQVELGLGLRATVGTEYGLVDYSAALEIGAEMALAPGLTAYGVGSAPLSNSGSYDDYRVFASQRFTQSQLTQRYLTYWAPVGPLLAQASWGYFNATDQGAQADVLWLSDSGRWRLHGLAAHYVNTTDASQAAMAPVIGSVRYSVIPSVWHIDVAGGQYYNGDQGWNLASSHFIGNAVFRVFMRRTGGDASPGKPQTSFAGFDVSIPFGPERAATAGAMSLRGRDRWRTGLETKVGANDNYLTAGYGVVPQLRHGLTTDVTDFDRMGQADVWADRARLRFAMQ
ncbi:MAG: hypothetical protein WCK81_01635 [Betaproteobacteria bacterium]